MKGILKYLIAFSVLSGMVSCAYKEDMLLPNTKGNSTVVIASVENFSRHNVTTKATDDKEAEVQNIAVLLFGKADDESPYKLIADPIFVSGSSMNYVINTTNKYIANIQDGQENYKYFNNFTGSQCRLYIVANMNSKLNPQSGEKPNLNSEADFLNVPYTLPYSGDINEPASIGVPETGFPMIGYADINLENLSTSETLTVLLKKLFAKINVRFRVQVDGENNPDHMSNIQKPFFEPQTWSVHNIPTEIKLQESDSLQMPNIPIYSTTALKIFDFGPESSDDKKVEHSTSSDEYFQISFYMPEYRISPAYHNKDNKYPYPANIDENSKQFYKPLLCSAEQKPTYVKITGKYSNHQGISTDVTYLLYLGQDETDNFQIFRNQELNNYVTVKGLTNHDEAVSQTISADHRVHIDAQGFSIAMERETLLDSHFEFRPMDITVQEGSTVTLQIPSDIAWVAAERSEQNYRLGNNDDYDPAKPGLRKFFTTNLISNLKNAPKADNYFTFEGPDDDGDPNTTKTNKYRLWFYFDEFVNTGIPAYNAAQPTSDTNQLFRDAQITVTCTDSNPATVDQIRIFTFRQMNLWAINVYDEQNDNNLLRSYTIEYFEEYLYNYASDDGYDVVQDGMEWGLEGQQLSTKYQAIYSDSSQKGGFIEWLELIGFSSSEFYNDAFNGIETNYDYYLTRDEAPSGAIVRDYSGLKFTQELVNQGELVDDSGNTTGVLIASNERYLSQSKKIKSAVEYCFNKNKRNAEGKVSKINWYLPAIDQTEEILLAGFDYFPVFQSRYYWSSQPAFQQYDYETTVVGNIFGIPIQIGRAFGHYYKDDINNARATKVTENETDIFASGVNGSTGIFPIDIRVIDWSIGWGGLELECNVESSPEDERDYVSEDDEYYDDGDIHQPGNKSRSTKNRIRCVYSPTGLPVTPTTTN